MQVDEYGKAPTRVHVKGKVKQYIDNQSVYTDDDSIVDYAREDDGNLDKTEGQTWHETKPPRKKKRACKPPLPLLFSSDMSYPYCRLIPPPRSSSYLPCGLSIL